MYVPDTDGIEYKANQVFLLASDFDLLRKIQLRIFVCKTQDTNGLDLPDENYKGFLREAKCLMVLSGPKLDIPSHQIGEIPI